jgi:polar amino acid transport system substrate-binding protein
MWVNCKKWWVVGIALGCCVSALSVQAESSTTATNPCPKQIRLPYNSNWLPYLEITDETVTGTDIELIRKVIKLLGSELELISLPESRALNDLQSGKVDLLFGASFTAERGQFAWFSQPYRREVNVVIVHPQVLVRFPELTDKAAFLELARRKLIGTFNPKGFYGSDFEQLKQHEAMLHRSVAIFDAEQRIALVLSQRADYTLADQASVQYRFQMQPIYQQLVVLPFELSRSDIHLMLSKKTVSEACLKQINQNLIKMGRSLKMGS